MTDLKQRSLNPSIRWPATWGRQIPLIIVWLLIVVFVITFVTLSLRRHATLASNGLDLGNVNQALYNTARGDFLAFTNMAPIRSRLALHVEPILVLLVPFYWLGVGSPRLLLVVQALVVGLGALPLYWLAQNTIRSSYSAKQRVSEPADLQAPVLPKPYSLLPIVFPLSYLLLPALEAAVMYDFHALSLAPTFLLFAFYFFEEDRPWLFGLFAALALACKEDMGLTLAALGLYLILARRRWGWGGVTVLVGLTWFAFAVFLIQPRFSPTGSNIQADRYAWLGETPSAMIGFLLRRPGVVWEHLWRQANLPAYLGGLLLPTAFLSVLHPLALLPALPSLAVNLLSDNPFTWRLEDFHYAAPIAPFFFVAAVYGVGRLAAWAGHRTEVGRRYVLAITASLLLVASLVYHHARGFSPLAWPFQPWRITDHQRRAEAIFAQVPSAASLFAQSNLNPHVSSRRVLYQEPAVLMDPALTEGLPAPDYLLFDVSSLVNQDDFHRLVVSDLLGGGSFGPVVAEDGFLLLASGASPESLPDDFFDFARAERKDIAYPLVADFGEVLRLHGFDLHFERAEEVQVVLYMAALRELDEGFFISLYLLDQWGNPLGATIEDQPALVWYPTDRWRPGELIKVTFNTLPWYSRDLSAYRLALGVTRGSDPWQPAARLDPSLPPEATTSYAIRLPEGGTLLELARFRQAFSLGILRSRPQGGPAERLFRRPRIKRVLGVSLGGEVRLLGYDMDPVTCKVLTEGRDSFVGGSPDECWLELFLFWQAQRPMENDYTTFVHVVESSGHILAQRDAPPDSGAYPTRRWMAGEVVIDPVRVPLPTDVLGGPLQVVVGMYRPDTGQRLSVLDARGQPIDDKVLLGQVTVELK